MHAGQHAGHKMRARSMPASVDACVGVRTSERVGRVGGLWASPEKCMQVWGRPPSRRRWHGMGHRQPSWPAWGSARRSKKRLSQKSWRMNLANRSTVVDQRPSRVWGFGKVLPANSHECNPVVMLCVLSSWAPVGTIHGVQTSGRAAAGAHVVAPRMQAADAAASSTWSLFSRDKVCADATLW